MYFKNKVIIKVYELFTMSAKTPLRRLFYNVIEQLAVPSLAQCVSQSAVGKFRAVTFFSTHEEM